VEPSSEPGKPAASNGAGSDSTYLKDFIYGAIDGAVTTFAVVSGVAGAGLPSSIIIILGNANLVADGFSMATGNFLGNRAENQVMDKLGDTLGKRKSSLRAALVTLVAFVIVGAIPLISFVINWIVPGTIANPFLWSSVLTGVAFFAIGASKSRFVVQHWMWCGIETLAVGGIAASIAYGIGLLLEGMV
jgi:VIT1/CCC1 family predicted Fe2+/Mn2+ transporter